jgi:hypothetical protein
MGRGFFHWDRNTYREVVLFKRKNVSIISHVWGVSVFLILEFGFQRAAGRNTLL